MDALVEVGVAVVASASRRVSSLPGYCFRLGIFPWIMPTANGMGRKLLPKEEKINHILYSPELLRNVGFDAADTMLLMLLMLMLILGIVQRGL
jgi:hypothetical protein